MTDRLRKLGIVMTVIGVIFAAVGVFAFTQVQAGSDSLQAFSEAQNVTLSYNEDGQLIDRGQTEGADAIMDLLVNEWGYPVKTSELDPNDPLVNTASEYMFQMATIGYHVLHGTQTVELTEDATYNDELFPAGVYELDVRTVGERGELGGYWTDFDRQHPIEGPARSQAWSGTAHGLFGELGVGTVTASTLQMGLGLSALIFGMGMTIMLLGAGMFWVGKGKEEDTYHVLVDSAPEPEPAGI
ncbi:MAG: hypothetical protein GWP18_00600 [Proteobacteria bacterium]|nr:hypothetical protein [Pseudomonadota bacterium]